MYIIRCNDQLLTTTKQQQQQKQQREGTASTLHMLADVGTHPEAKRTQQWWQGARAGEQQLVSSSSILSIAATTTSADGTVTSQDDLNGAPVPNSDEAQWWRQWRQLSLQHECERLQTLVDSHTRKKTNGNGTGKNKQTMSLTDTANMSNKTALMSCTKDSIWPSYKFLFFRGRWNVYDTICPHAFDELCSVTSIIRWIWRSLLRKLRLAHSFFEVKFVERKLCYKMQKYIQ